VLLAGSLLVASTPARADDDVEPARVGLRGPRLGITPGIGVGIASFTGHVTELPTFVGTSVLNVEGIFELQRWGLFVRGGYMSSGQSGRWTAPQGAVGAQYRLQGDGEVSWGLTARLGLVFERWSGSAAGCDVALLIPQNCQYYVNAPPGAPSTAMSLNTNPYSVSVNTLGLLAQFRVEAPIRPVYLALGAEVAAMADVEASDPGAVLTAQFTITFGLRNHARADTQAPRRDRRWRHNGY
jgi:hypothetical protein